MLRSFVTFLYRHLVHWRMRNRHSRAWFDASVQWRGEGTVDLEPGVFVGPNSVITVPAGGSLRLRQGVWLGRDCEISAGTRMQIGERSSLQHRTQLHGDVSIGAGCVGAANLYASSGAHEFRNPPEIPIRVQDFHRVRRPADSRSRPISIGDDCWLGVNVVVAPGIAIGRGCVVGANSVVTENLAPYSIAAGAPARVIGHRLAFLPPREIRANEDADLPYFYAGFRQLADDEGADDCVPRRRGGYPAHPAFSIAMKADSGERVEIMVDALAACRIRHGDNEETVPAGPSTVSFAAVPDDLGLLKFHHDRVGADALVVTAGRMVVASP
jgi:acetyltransferase-like isoleucine patch superfamily enzyme